MSERERGKEERGVREKSGGKEERNLFAAVSVNKYIRIATEADVATTKRNVGIDEKEGTG